MQTYQVDTLALIAKYNGDRDTAADELVKRVRTNEIFFPFHIYFVGEAKALFEGIKRLRPTIKHGRYRLYSYKPSFKLYLPPLFRGQSIVISSDMKLYNGADVLSDLFIEDMRLRAKRYDQPLSMLEAWMNDTELKKLLLNALQAPMLDPRTLRGMIYGQIAEVRQFRPTWCRGLLEQVLFPELNRPGVAIPDTLPYLKGKRWLDISAGWGDRLLAAMAFDMEYLGFDPNLELKPKHDQMIQMFGTGKQQVIYEPFETAQIPTSGYDVVLSSPPYFNVEDYTPGVAQPNQSINQFPDFKVWMTHFLFAAVEKAFRHLRVGGYLILHLGDVTTVKMVEPMNLFIERFMPDASWLGILPVEGEGGYPRGTWVWERVDLEKQLPNRWNPQIPRSLLTMYPALAQEEVRYQAELISPSYKATRVQTDTFLPVLDQAAIPVRDHVIDQLKVNPLLVETLTDPLLINGLIKDKGPNITVRWIEMMNQLVR
jgi:hypothetical protein